MGYVRSGTPGPPFITMTKSNFLPHTRRVTSKLHRLGQLSAPWIYHVSSFILEAQQ
jgi:hypothetical protein